MTGSIIPESTMSGEITPEPTLEGVVSFSTIQMSVTDYDVLLNKPKINNVTVQGSKRGSDYGLASESELNTQKARIDQIIRGGSVSPDAELVDIRIGFDDTTYETAGDAVRGQAEQLNDKIDAEMAGLAPVFDAVFVEGNSSGSIATFDDGSEMPLKTLQVSIEPVQSGSGEPSPSNVRPISGWTECNIQRTGKNLIDASAVKVGYIYNRTQMDYQESSNWVSTDYIPVIEGKSYKFTYNNGTNGVISQLQGINKDKTSAEQLSASSGGFTVPSGIAYVIICTNNTSTKDNVATWQLEVGTTGSTYQAYTGNDVYTVAFTDGTNPLTVYGGTAKVFMDGGKWYCTVTKTSGIRKLSDMPTNRWNKLSSGTGAFYMGKGYSLPDISTEYSSADLTRAMLSDIYNKSPSGTMTEATFRVSDALYIVDSRYADITEFINAIPNNDASFIYPLATPTTTTFEIDTCIASILGVNNVWADTGEVNTLTYYRNLNITINKLLES